MIWVGVVGGYMYLKCLYLFYRIYIYIYKYESINLLKKMGKKFEFLSTGIF